MMVNNISGFELGVATAGTVTTEHKKILNVPNDTQNVDILSSFLTFRAGVAILTISIVAVVAIRVMASAGVML